MRKRDFLVPPEKNRRVIQLDRRGPVKKEGAAGAVILCILSVLCLAYCLGIALFMGYGTTFFLVWGVLSVFFGILSFLKFHPRLLEKIPKFLRYAFAAVFLAGLIFFCVVECMIGSCFMEKPSGGADYVIILGAQWKTSGPSYVLQKRLDAAAAYLKDNPDTLVIVSGGQGSNEPISEAQGMKEYLLGAGIEEDRIMMEDSSTNTNTNLLYSGRMLDKANDHVVLVTNNFHVFRACSIARHQGYAHLEGMAAGSYPGMLPNNLLREFFGVVKDFLVGNM